MTTSLAPPPAEPATRLGPESNGMLMTSEEFGAVTEGDRGYRYELIRGIVIVSPPPSPGSRGPAQELGRLLLNYRDDHPLGKAMDDTLPENYIRVRDDWRLLIKSSGADWGAVPMPTMTRPRSQSNLSRRENAIDIATTSKNEINISLAA